jgi:hypothetical protein
VLPWVVLGARRIFELGRGTRLAFSLVCLPLFIGLLPGGLSLPGTWQVVLVFQLPTLALLGAVWLDRRVHPDERRLPRHFRGKGTLEVRGSA